MQKCRCDENVRVLVQQRKKLKSLISKTNWSTIAVKLRTSNMKKVLSLEKVYALLHRDKSNPLPKGDPKSVSNYFNRFVSKIDKIRDDFSDDNDYLEYDVQPPDEQFIEVNMDYATSLIARSK